MGESGSVAEMTADRPVVLGEEAAAERVEAGTVDVVEDEAVDAGVDDSEDGVVDADGEAVVDGGVDADGTVDEVVDVVVVEDSVDADATVSALVERSASAPAALIRSLRTQPDAPESNSTLYQV
jgi:hypothetical protein